MSFLRTALALGLTLLAMSAEAGVVVPLSVEQLTERAALVVHAHVTSQHVEKTRGGRIVTVSTLTVEERLKGDAPQTVLVRTQGGIIDGRGEQVAGEARLHAAEEVVVFLRSTRLTDGSFAVLGMAQGKFTVTGEEAHRTVLQDLTDLGFAPGAGAPIEDRVAVPVALSDLKLRIARAGAP